jgi:hypothetical protein
MTLASPLLNLIAVIMEFIGSLISFVVGYYALKAYRTSGSRGLFTLYWGFTVLGIGVFLRAFTATYIRLISGVYEAPRQLVGLIDLVALIYSITQLVAYSFIVATYVFQARPQSEKVAVAGSLSVAAAAVFPLYRLFYIPWLELVSITMLAFVVVSTFINWRTRRSSESALVFLGFVLIMLCHVFFLFLVVSEMFLLLGQVTQLAGFICLSAMLAKVSRANG